MTLRFHTIQIQDVERSLQNQFKTDKNVVNAGERICILEEKIFKNWRNGKDIETLENNQTEILEMKQPFKNMA